MSNDQIIEGLVQEFADNVAAQSAAIKAGDSKLGNQHASTYIAAFNKLRSFGDTGRGALCRLFEDDRLVVRATAAAFLLRFKNAEATKILEDIGKGGGILGLGASQCLKNWKRGDWHLDPED